MNLLRISRIPFRHIFNKYKNVRVLKTLEYNGQLVFPFYSDYNKYKKKWRSFWKNRFEESSFFVVIIRNIFNQQFSWK